MEALSASVITLFKLSDLKYMNAIEEYFCPCLPCPFKLVFLAKFTLFVCILATLYGMKYCIRDNRVTMETLKSTIGIFFDFLV